MAGPSFVYFAASTWIKSIRHYIAVLGFVITEVNNAIDAREWFNNNVSQKYVVITLQKYFNISYVY